MPVLSDTLIKARRTGVMLTVGASTELSMLMIFRSNILIKLTKWLGQV
jgi:hypothetical protein